MLGIVVVVVLGAIWAWIGLSIARRVKSADDYLVGGRNVGIGLGSATLLATWITGNTILAAPESGYDMGILGVLGYALLGGLGVMAFAPLAKRIRTAIPNGRTVGDFFQIRFDHKNYVLFLIALIIWDVGWLLTQGLGAGILLQSVFGVPFHVGLVITVAIVTAYVTFGGMRSVLGTDFLQCMLIMVVVFIFPAWVFGNAGFHTVYSGIQKLSPSALSLTNPTGIAWLIAGPLIGIGEVFMDNTFWQRAYSLRPSTVNKTYLFSGLGWMFVPIATGSLALVALGTGFKPNPVNSVAPDIVSQYTGQLGGVLFLALLWAAIASTLAALLNAVAAIFMNDIYQRYINPNATNKQLLKAGKIATVVIAVVTIIAAWPEPMTMLSLLTLMGVINAAYIIPITLGLFWSKTNRHGVFYGALIGSIVGLFIYGNGTFDLIFVKIPVTHITWGGPYPGVIAGGFISLTLTVVWSWLQPETFNFASFRKYRADRAGVSVSSVSSEQVEVVRG